MPARWFLINLDRSADRLVWMRQQLDALGLEVVRVAAVDGQTLSLDHPGLDPKGFWRDAAMQVRTTDAACYLSHLAALRMFLEAGTAYGVILEDDVVLGPATAGVVETLTAAGAPDDWDMVKLTGNNRLRALPLRPVDGHFRLGVPWTRCLGAAAYLVNRRAAQRYLERMLPMTVLYDHAFDRGWALGLRTRIVVPPPASGRASDLSRRSTIDTPDRPRVKNRTLGKATSLWWRARNETTRVGYAGWAWLRWSGGTGERAARRLSPSEHVRVDVALDHVLDEEQQQQQNDRGDVDASEIGQDAADRPQQGLGQGVDEVPDRSHELVAKIDDVEGEQPRQDRRRDDQVGVDVKDKQDDI